MAHYRYIFRELQIKCNPMGACKPVLARARKAASKSKSKSLSQSDPPTHRPSKKCPISMAMPSKGTPDFDGDALERNARFRWRCPRKECPISMAMPSKGTPDFDGDFDFDGEWRKCGAALACITLAAAGAASTVGLPACARLAPRARSGQDDLLAGALDLRRT